MTTDYDLIAIGSGPAGQRAAVQAAKLGRRAAVIERANVLGGASTNTGTVPSKTLRAAIVRLTGCRPKHEVELDDLVWRAQQVIEHEREVIFDQLRRNNVDVVTGTALSALGAMAGVPLLVLVATSGPVRRRAGVDDLRSARAVPLLLALVAVGSLLSLPAQNLVSRAIEARADRHSLELTDDPDTLVSLQQRLAERYRVIAVDRPGHGWSDRVDRAEAAKPDRQAAILAEGLRKLGVSRAVVVGHDPNADGIAAGTARVADIVRRNQTLTPEQRQALDDAQAEAGKSWAVVVALGMFVAFTAFHMGTGLGAKTMSELAGGTIFTALGLWFGAMGAPRPGFWLLGILAVTLCMAGLVIGRCFTVSLMSLIK